MLLDENQTLKITDFGVARLEALNSNEMTGCTGSLGYMAPEVCILLKTKHAAVLPIIQILSSLMNSEKEFVMLILLI